MDDRRLLDHALDQLAGAAQQALREMRLMLYELQLPTLVQRGLVEALRHRLRSVEERVGVEAHLVVEGTPECPKQVEQALYFITLEALNNALKHGSASSVTIQVSACGGQVELRVADDGVGFELEEAETQGGLGLSTMRERASAVGGALSIVSTPGAGTLVAVAVPYGEQAGDASVMPIVM
jgi:signal transduction histidine kinase